jgi:hypothetical protein
MQNSKKALRFLLSGNQWRWGPFESNKLNDRYIEGRTQLLIDNPTVRGQSARKMSQLKH